MTYLRMSLAFIIPLATVFILCSKKVLPAIALLVGALLAALISGMPLREIPATINNSFGNMLSNVGLLILFGIAFSQLLSESGGVTQLVKSLLNMTGAKKDIFSVGLISYMLSIPVNAFPACSVMAPVIREMSEKTQKPVDSYAAVFSVNCFLTTFCVIPTAGPIMVAAILNINLGWFMFWGILLTAFLGGATTLFFYLLSRRHVQESPTTNTARDSAAASKAPPAKIIASLIFLPVVLIFAGSFIPALAPNPIFSEWLAFIGSPTIALFLSVVLSYLFLHKYLKRPIIKIFENSIKEAGAVLIMLGCAAAFGGICQASGIGQFIVDAFSLLKLPMLPLAYIILVIIHVGTGTGIAAAATVATLFAPLLPRSQTSLVLFGIVMGLGQLAFIVHTDPLFWFFGKTIGLDTKRSLKYITLPATIVSVLGFVLVCILGLFSHILPGLL